jgi:hypothetical protein
MNVAHTHDSATLAHMMFSRNEVKLCDLIVVTHSDDLRGCGNQRPHDVNDGIKTRDEVSIRNQAGGAARYKIEVSRTNTDASNHRESCE